MTESVQKVARGLEEKLRAKTIVSWHDQVEVLEGVRCRCDGYSLQRILGSDFSRKGENQQKFPQLCKFMNDFFAARARRHGRDEEEDDEEDDAVVDNPAAATAERHEEQDVEEPISEQNSMDWD
uniref:Uncharacterized protein n=1 Tax=Chromera velia CCMP2878 TaxID=1169474 RepID=A0A0G4I659_9ALVE|eukprot:Cvel_11306.t1-p1 / transcript=Cvel_11306.t1 / gene=Cvel_11306 / organism=Chromera_velia_CCMP2878 / gene_product=hypothetical protein / transcript_product=hypothetical protein / location=Cvel_scaffold706:69086-69454(+) / protein_length=123 / sequence_SO=supercontig / SO=protein_coding / is_pseudo=false